MYFVSLRIVLIVCLVVRLSVWLLGLLHIYLRITRYKCLHFSFVFRFNVLVYISVSCSWIASRVIRACLMTGLALRCLRCVLHCTTTYLTRRFVTTKKDRWLLYI